MVVCNLQGNRSSCGTAQDKLGWRQPRALARLGVSRRSQVFVPSGTAWSVPPRAVRRHVVLRPWGLVASWHSPRKAGHWHPLVLPSASSPSQCPGRALSKAQGQDLPSLGWGSGLGLSAASNQARLCSAPELLHRAFASLHSGLQAPAGESLGRLCQEWPLGHSQAVSHCSLCNHDLQLSALMSPLRVFVRNGPQWGLLMLEGTKGLLSYFAFTFDSESMRGWFNHVLQLSIRLH